MTGSAKKKCRQYIDEYLQYGFIQNSTDSKQPFRLMCHQSLSNETMKPSRFYDHMRRQFEKVGKPIKYFEGLKTDFENRNTVKSLFKKQAKINDGGLIASYTISEIITKTGSAHTVAEKIILFALEAVISEVMNQDPSPIIKALLLSNDSIRRRIDEMSGHIEDVLIQRLKTTNFSIQTDESTYISH
ncbi:Hypothetical predicted protein [Octopus vulgaris]|uniref:Uncharacterized protein n=1 Tax=Octopus vulgaris TaxID=6645 RepID=A0AA36F7H0_OCTVU|nr:Hypothetical predicted protein [Octopus vulgaris]